MPRIRSIHPGIFTDEAFMAASPHARLLIIGLWTEAFDDGCFEMKPLTLKARIFPVDNVDMDGLLSELEGLRVFRRFGSSGKEWGAIRNFRKYQRPKIPNESGALNVEMADYVGMSRKDKQHPAHAKSEKEADLFPVVSSGSPSESSASTEPPSPAPPPPIAEQQLSHFLQKEKCPDLKGEMGALMEDGGDKMEEKKEEAGKPANAQAREPASPPVMTDQEYETACVASLGGGNVKGSFKLLLAVEGDRERIIEILRSESAKRPKPIGSWQLAATVATEGLASKSTARPLARASPAPIFTGRKINTPSGIAFAEDFLRAEHNAGRWRKTYGPAPGLPGCVLPN